MILYPKLNNTDPKDEERRHGKDIVEYKPSTGKYEWHRRKQTEIYKSPFCL